MKGAIKFVNQMYFFLAAVAMLAGCAENRRDTDILDKQEMVQIMEELYIAEEKVNNLAIPRDSAKQVFSRLEFLVFEDAAVKDSVFKKSFDYYMEHPDELELIYTALVDSLQLREQRAPIHQEKQ